jgi:hypothetical protein
MAKKMGGAGKGQMTDVAYRGKQGELQARKEKLAAYERQTDKSVGGIQQGAQMAEAKAERTEAKETQKSQFEEQQATQKAQFQQGQALNAAKADLEYDPETRSYRATALGQQKQKIAGQRAQTERMEVMSKIHQQEFDNHLKLEQHKLALQREGRLTEQEYMNLEEKTNAQIAKYDTALKDLQTGGKSDVLSSLFPDATGKAALSAAQKGDPQAQEMVMNKLKNRVNYLALRASSITGAWPNLDPNSPTGQAWVEHHRGVDGQIRQMAQAYAMVGQRHPLQGLSTRQQKRFIIEESARTFLPIFAMKTARMQNGAGTGSPTPGAGGVQPGGKYGQPNPQPSPGSEPAAGPSAPAGPGVPERGTPEREESDRKLQWNRGVFGRRR